MGLPLAPLTYVSICACQGRQADPRGGPPCDVRAGASGAVRGAAQGHDPTGTGLRDAAYGLPRRPQA